MEGGMKNWRFFQQMSRFISKTVQEKTIVTMEDEQELVRDLSNGTTSNDLERHLTQI